MKKNLVLLAMLTLGLTSALAQKFAYVDTEYILGKMPEYTSAQAQIEKLTDQYQAVIDSEIKKVDQLFRTYQTEKSRLNDVQRQQRDAYVDTEYILGKMSEYTSAQAQIEKLNDQYQAIIESEIKKVDQLFKTYQAEKNRLNDVQRQQREQDIINKEQAVKELQKTYFGQEGTVTKKSEDLMKPIKDKVQRAIDALAREGGYAVIFDTAAGPCMIYLNPTYDLSNRVLDRLGIKY